MEVIQLSEVPCCQSLRKDYRDHTVNGWFHHPSHDRTATNSTAAGTSTKNPIIANRTCTFISPHQNNAATGIIITNRSRAIEPSQPRNSIRSVAFIVASGGICCSQANQYRVSEKEQCKSGARACRPVHWNAQCTPGQRAAYGQLRQRNNGLRQPACSRASRNTGSLVHGLFLPMEFSHSFECSTNHGILGGFDGDCSGIKCGVNHPHGRASNAGGSVGPASLPDTRYQAKAQSICGSGKEPTRSTTEGMKRCASRLAAGRTAVARGVVSVTAARTFPSLWGRSWSPHIQSPMVAQPNTPPISSAASIACRKASALASAEYVRVSENTNKPSRTAAAAVITYQSAAAIGATGPASCKAANPLLIRCATRFSSQQLVNTNTPEASGTAATMAPSGLACRSLDSDRRTLRSGSARWIVDPVRVEPAGEAELSSRLIFSFQSAQPATPVHCDRDSGVSHGDRIDPCWPIRRTRKEGCELPHSSLWGRAARSARQPHKLKVAGSNPAPATSRRVAGEPACKNQRNAARLSLASVGESRNSQRGHA